MSQVFLSYAHVDGPFVDRLHRDLAAAGIPVTYDKVALEIGDSIVEKISGLINASACVVGVVSPASIGSKWVQRELSWALTGELGGQAVRVFPAVIGDCAVPAMLADKRFADFRQGYFPALRDLLRAIRRSLAGEPDAAPPTAPARMDYDAYLRECEQVETAIAHHDSGAAFTWLQQHSWVVAALVANPRDVVLTAPAAAALPANRAFVCWTLATQALWHLVSLGPMTAAEMTPEAVWAEAERLESQARAYTDDLTAFIESCALQEAGGPLAGLRSALEPDQTPRLVAAASAEQDRWGRPDYRPRDVVLDRLILLVGRRDHRSTALLELRRRAKRELGVEVKSYEWLLDALGAKAYRRDAEAV